MDLPRAPGLQPRVHMFEKAGRWTQKSHLLFSIPFINGKKIRCDVLTKNDKGQTVLSPSISPVLLSILFLSLCGAHACVGRSVQPVKVCKCIYLCGSLIVNTHTQGKKKKKRKKMTAQRTASDQRIKGKSRMVWLKDPWRKTRVEDVGAFVDGWIVVTVVVNLVFLGFSHPPTVHKGVDTAIVRMQTRRWEDKVGESWMTASPWLSAANKASRYGGSEWVTLPLHYGVSK